MSPTPEQVAQWARDEIEENPDGEIIGLTQSELHRLVTRAMAEQAEADAKLCGQVGARQTEFEAADCAVTIRANAPKETP